MTVWRFHAQLRQRDHRDDEAEQEQDDTGHDEEVRRAVDEQEAQVAPAVAPARELRLAAARRVGDRELADVELLLRGPDDHLGGELHAGRAQVQARQDVAPEAAHAAVRVADAGAEEEVQRAAEDRVADVAVDPVHRAGLDVVHPVAHHELGAVAQRLDEARDVLERVRHVGVEHHDVLAAGGAEAREVGRAVAAARLVHDARAGGRGELGAAVVGVVVGDDDLAGHARLGKRRERLAHAGLDVLGLVEAGDDDGDLDRGCGGLGSREPCWSAVDRGHDRVRANPGWGARNYKRTRAESVALGAQP